MPSSQRLTWIVHIMARCRWWFLNPRQGLCHKVKPWALYNLVPSRGEYVKAVVTRNGRSVDSCGLCPVKVGVVLRRQPIDTRNSYGLIRKEVAISEVAKKLCVVGDIDVLRIVFNAVVGRHRFPSNGMGLYGNPPVGACITIGKHHRSIILAIAQGRLDIHATIIWNFRRFHIVIDRHRCSTIVMFGFFVNILKGIRRPIGTSLSSSSNGIVTI
ncbi:hypothetical protein GQ607_008831 [Colletotrichum asianum]|uniref:Uncharacterized protein n=1 Tax=Colletotrichum asianum TaxID=702518 RepID=A0A8H3ZL48_9PEZI|nr:hypothetical protein GQ607_008831 [Colletotrichum asianum]